MLDSIEEELQSKYQGGKKYLVTFVKWLFLSIFIGCVCGAAGTLFFHCVSISTRVRTAHLWLIYLLPFAGLLIAFAYHMAGLNRDKGTNLVIHSIRSKEVVPLRMSLLIFVSTALTHLVLLNEKELHVMTMCGMSAVFSALFGTPLTATVFSIEVVSVGLMHYSALVPCLFSSILAYEIATHAGVVYETYHLTDFPPETLLSYGRIIVIGLICAAVGVIFCEIMHKTGRLLHFYVRNRYALVFAGGALIVLLTKLCGTYDYNGAGGDVIARALEGDAVWYAFLMKILFTAITLSTSGKCTHSRDEQPKNARSPTSNTDSGNVTDFKPVHPEKAPLPMESSDSGSSRDWISSWSAKASSKMRVTPSGTTTCVSPVPAYSSKIRLNMAYRFTPNHPLQAQHA